MTPKELAIKFMRAAAKGAITGITQAVDEELDKIGDTKSEQLHALADKLGAVDANKTGLDDLLAIGFRVAAQLLEAGEQREPRP